MTAPPKLDQLEQKLCEHIETVLNQQAYCIQPETPLQSLGMDSLQLVSLLVAIEKQYAINLMNAGLEREDLTSPQTLAKRLYMCLQP